MRTRSRLVEIVIFFLVALSEPSPEVQAIVLFRDGMDHIIDGTIDDSVGVGSDRADHTHVFLNSGGTITGDVLVGEDGLFVMRGGTVGGLVHAGGDGRVTISGGVVGGDVVAFFDIGRVTLEGGSMMGDFIVD